MPDITKGYTFTDSKADWASEKDTAIRLNKMVDDAKVNIVAGTGVTVARTNGNIVVSATSGSGTVTNVSVVTANGVSGTVANPTTTPAITLALGAITPTSVAASGSVTGSNLSGTNTGDQTITLTGDVTGSGTGSFAATIANNAVTNTKLADMAASTIKGRQAGSTGDPQDLTGTQATALLDTFTSSLKGLAPSSGGGTSNYLRADGTWSVPAGTAIGVPTTAQQYSRLVNNSTPVTAGSFVNGITYVIKSVGSTNFTLVGAANNLVGTVFTATGAGSGTGTATPSITSSSNMKWVGPDIYNVKDYGATGNGSTNDASAINSAIADINTAGFGCLYFPQGVYVVSSALTTITASCSVMGTGVSSTEIQFTVSGFKFDFSGTANSKTARVSDMKLTRTSGSSLVGIEYVPTTDLNARHRFDFSHLNLFEWNTAIYINSGAQNRVQSGFISYCHINGDGTRANSPYGIRLKNATGVKISGCWFISVGKCISVEDNGESVSALDCSAAAVDYFFFADQDGSGFVRADHRIVDCYMAVDVRGITIGDTDGISYCVISNNVVATQINTAEAIRVKGDYTTITGNTIWPDKGSSPAVTIKVVGGNNNLVSSNIIQDKAIVLESGTTNCRVVANTYKNVTGAFVTDSGTTNRCDEPVGEQYVKTLTGGAATENVDFDLSSFGLSKVPKYVSAVISGTHGASKIMCTYDYTSASSTATNARCVAWMTDGTNLPAGNRRFNVAVVP